MAGKTVLLAMGNDILGDDAAALMAARRLRGRVGDDVEIRESSEAGLAIIELLEGFDSALILDSVMTGRHPPGTLIEFTAEDFRKVAAPSPHYAGLPEVLEMAGRMDLEFPRRLRILAMEVENPFEVREGMTPRVEAAVPAFAERAGAILKELGGKT